MKSIEVGKTYYDERNGRYLEVLMKDKDYLCREFEIDENGNEITTATRHYMTRGELSKMIEA